MEGQLLLRNLATERRAAIEGDGIIVRAWGVVGGGGGEIGGLRRGSLIPGVRIAVLEDACVEMVNMGAQADK